MTGRTARATSVLATAVTVLLAHRTAYGYLDPGTGSYILQILLGGLLGGLFVLKMYWRRITTWAFRGKREKEREG